MANRIVIGKTPEQLQQEEAEFLRQREAEAQERNQEQERNLRMLVAKNKRNRIIVLSVSILIILALLIFGTYNTFIKHTLNNDDVAQQIYAQVIIFPDSGVEGFLKENFNTWYQKMVTNSQNSENKIQYVRPIIDTLTVDTIRVDSNTLARVYFSVDIESKQQDTKNALNEIIPGEINVSRYNFFILVECNYIDSPAGGAVAQGYRAASDLSYFMLSMPNIPDIIESDHVAFHSEEDTENGPAARIKIDKILKDLYDGADVSQDVKLVRPFINPNGDTYIGLNTFTMYKEKNDYGYNTKVTYTVLAKDGYYYINTIYLAVFTNGSTWSINGWT